MWVTARLALVFLALAAPARAAVVYRCGDNLCRVPDAGGTPKALTADGNPAVPYRSPSLSADGRRLAFVHAGRVYVAEANAQHPVGVPGTQGAIAVKLRPDGARVAFVTYHFIPGPMCEPGDPCPLYPSSHVDSLFTTRLDGSAMRLRTYTSAERLDFGWLGDALTVDAPNHDGVCVLRGPDCGRWLAGPLAWEMGALAVSPAGDLLAVRGQSGRALRRHGIALFATRTRHLLRFLTTLRRDDQPTWSPDGRSILFTRVDSIYRLRLDASRPTLVAHGMDPTTESARPPAPRSRRRSAGHRGAGRR